MALQIKSKKWQGQDNWQCPFCSHASIGRRSDMEAHVVSRHPVQVRNAELKKEAAKDARLEAKQPPTAPVLPAAGNEGGS